MACCVNGPRVCSTHEDGWVRPRNRLGRRCLTPNRIVSLLRVAATPSATVVGVEGLGAEQAQLGASDEFWKLIFRSPKGADSGPRGS